MSTAGKVLSVLVLLASLAWIFLAAGVAQLNRNGSERLAKLEADVQKAQEGLEQARTDLAKVKDDTTNFQEGMDAQIAVIRARTGDVEAANSRLKGVLNNMQAQLANMEATVEQARHDLDVRKEEKETETKLLADARAEVMRLRGVDEDLTGRLTSLRQEFESTFKENIGKVATSSR